MSQRALCLLVFAAVTVGVVACTAGTSTYMPAGDGAPAGSSTSATEPGSALGPSCVEYLACCVELAEKTPQLGASCDAVKRQIEVAQANGVSTSSYEAACKSGVDGFTKAGYCKQAPVGGGNPPPVERKCVGTCTSDSDCMNSCPALSGGVQCCDPITRACFGSKTSSCPKPDDGGGDPPPSY